MIFYDESSSPPLYPCFHASSYSSSLVPSVSSPSSLSSSSSSSSYQTFSWRWKRTGSSPVSAAQEDCQARDRSSRCQVRGQLGPRGHHWGHSRHSMMGDPAMTMSNVKMVVVGKEYLDSNVIMFFYGALSGHNLQ